MCYLLRDGQTKKTCYVYAVYITLVNAYYIGVILLNSLQFAKSMWTISGVLKNRNEEIPSSIMSPY